MVSCVIKTRITDLHRFILPLLLIFAGLTTGFAAEPPAPTCALVVDRAYGLDTSPLVGLLETKLLQSPKIHMLERAEIAKLLQEQTMARIFGPEGGASRIETGKLLKADLLVLVKAEEVREGQQQTRRVQLMLSETRQGVRVQMGTVRWTPDAEADATLLMPLIERGLAKYTEQIAEVCAVTPLINEGATHQLDHLGGSYARLIQERILSQRGMVVVEISEAQAITHELALAGDNTVTRRTPLFISGEFRHTGVGAQQRVSLHLVLRRGNTQVAEHSKGDLVPDAVGASLLEATQALLAKVNTPAMPAWDATKQAAQLAEQANLLKQTGNWTEALNVMDASLLLNPAQPQLLQDAALMCARIVTSYEYAHMRKADAWWYVPNAEASLQYYHRIRDYLGAYLRQSPANTPDPYDTALYTDFRGALPGYLYALLTGNKAGPPELTAAYKKIFDEQYNQAIARVAQDVAARQITHLPAMHTVLWYVDFQCNYYGYTESQQYDLWLRTLRLTHEYPTLEYFLVDAVSVKFYDRFNKAKIATPEFQAFAKQVEAIGGPYMQTLADYLRTMRKDEEKGGVTRIVLPRPAELPPIQQAPPPPPPPLAPQLPVTPATITPLTVTLRDEAGNPVLMPMTRAWMPCGNGIDATIIDWGEGLFLMKTKGIMKRIYKQPPATNIIGMHYDGTFIWLLLQYQRRGKRDLTNLPKCLLVAVNPITEKIVTVGEEDGLIPSLTMKAAPWKPGSLFVAGNCGKAWCALVSVDNAGNKKVDILHEAHKYPEPTGWNPEARVEADFAYDPEYVVRFADQVTGAHLLLIKRSFFMGVQQVRRANPYPLLVDPVKRTVSVFPDPVRSWSVFSGAHDMLYYRHNDGPFQAIAYPETTSRTLKLPFADAMAGSLSYEQQRYHFRNLAKRQWWVSDSIVGPFAAVPLDAIPDTYKIDAVHPSNHYGYIVYATEVTPQKTSMHQFQLQLTAPIPKQ